MDLPQRKCPPDLSRRPRGRFFGKVPAPDQAASHRRYRIATALGTDLVFESRGWIPLDFEVCTAPVETSFHGTIVIDGALFFRAVTDPVTFVIRNGRLHNSSSSMPVAEALETKHRRLIVQDMVHIVNTQLAESSIGFCTSAAVSDCFMEAEAAANTYHFCFGNNFRYVGCNSSDFHGASLLIRDPVFTPLD